VKLGQGFDQIKPGAIIISTLITIGVLIFLAALGMTLTTYAEISEESSHTYAFFTILILTIIFFGAGFFASKIAHQTNVFSSVIHSLCTWAIISILLIASIFFAIAGQKVKSAVSAIHAPIIITDLKIFEGKAITTIKETPHHHHELDAKSEKYHKMFELIWPICSISLSIGLLVSIIAGILGYKKPLNN